MTNAISYQYTFTIERNQLDKIDPSIKDLAFGLDGWFLPYLNRKEVFFTMSLSDYGQDSFPIADITLELIDTTTDLLEFQLIVSAVISKLSNLHRKILETSLEKMIENDKLKIWWENDARGPRKRSIPDKRAILEQLKQLPLYNGSNDLQLEDIKITVPDALSFFGFDKDIKPKDLKKLFKKKFREFQLKYHPDSGSGDESTFMYLQNCKDVLDEWIKI